MLIFNLSYLCGPPKAIRRLAFYSANVPHLLTPHNLIRILGLLFCEAVLLLWCYQTPEDRER